MSGAFQQYGIPGICGSLFLPLAQVSHPKSIAVDISHNRVILLLRLVGPSIHFVDTRQWFVELLGLAGHEALARMEKMLVNHIDCRQYRLAGRIQVFGIHHGDRESIPESPGLVVHPAGGIFDASYWYQLLHLPVHELYP